MENVKIKFNWKIILQLALLAGIVYLASENKEGWGWLVFILLITIQ